MKKIINATLQSLIVVNLIIFGAIVLIIACFYLFGNANVIGLFTTLFGTNVIFYLLFILVLITNLVRSLIEKDYKRVLFILLFISLSLLLFFLLAGVFGAVHIKYID